MQAVGNPIALFLDARGTLLDGGQIYLGEASSDPRAAPIVAYWDSGLSVVAAQPLRTIGGRIVNGTNPARVFVAENDYAMRTEDAFGLLVDYSPTLYATGVTYQPLDSDLTAIAMLATTPFGRGLLTLTDQDALQEAAGYTPFTGGTVTSSITRQGAGNYAYGADPAMTGMRIFNPLPVGSADPTSQPGDLVGYY